MWLNFLASQLEAAIYSQPTEPTTAFRIAQTACRTYKKASDLPGDLLASALLWSMDRASKEMLRKRQHAQKEDTWEAQALSPTDRLD
ncbi:hypothetical protein KKG46_01590 [Patescibacteria group bacterium]|nr:hypothetical protein [Patescibacteria group bacterium]